MILRIGFFLLCLCFTAPACAEDYSPITWPDLLHTMIRFNALDVMSDNSLLDEYAAITDCDLYQYYYKDDFKWNQVRIAMRKSIAANMTHYPARYHFDARLKLDRYDFDAKLYRLADKNPIRQINTITIYEFEGPVCGDIHIKYFPLSYRAKLDPPVSIPGVALEPKAAEALLNYMNASGNNDHYIYARFNMTVIYIDPFRLNFKDIESHAQPEEYSQSNNDRGSITIDVRMESVGFYSDPERTKLVYTFTPPPT